MGVVTGAPRLTVWTVVDAARNPVGDRRRAAAGGCRKREGSDRVASELSAQDAGVSSLRNRDAACAGRKAGFGQRLDLRWGAPAAGRARRKGRCGKIGYVDL